MDDLNAFIEAYESAQGQGAAGDLTRFVPEPSHPLYNAILCELVRVDLEYSWKRGQTRLLEHYQATFPQLFQDRELLKQLAFEEFRLRHQAGLKPAPGEYYQRFQIEPESWPTMVLRESPRRRTGSPVLTQHHACPYDAAWGILDRFLKQLQNCDRMDEQVRLVLQAVQGSLGADAVFHWYADANTPAVTLVGPAHVQSSWCQEFAEKTLKLPGVATDQLLLPPLPAPPMSAGPHVSSAAFLRVSKSASAWIVALSFGPRRFDTTDLKVMMLARRMLLGQRQYSQTYARLKDALFSLIHCITAMIDARDPYTCGHSERVARIAVRLGKQMGLPAREQSDLYLAGLLHDVGKIGIRDQVLGKPGKLTPDEMKHVQEHPVIGDRILATVKQLASLRPGVRSHHERYDGKGYPDGLAGKDIPVLARVLAVADACDAMMSPRPYRPAMPTAVIDKIMVEGAGKQWDAGIIGHFLACRQELYAICQRGLGQSVLQAVGQVLEEENVHQGHQDHEDNTESEGS